MGTGVSGVAASPVGTRGEGDSCSAKEETHTEKKFDSNIFVLVFCLS